MIKHLRFIFGGVIALTVFLLHPIRTSAQQTIDERGPIENAGMHVSVSDAGVQAPGYRFRNNSQKPDPWQAKWIWPQEDGKAAVVCFRKELSLDDVPKSVAAWMTADIKYRLFINGKLAARGPVDIGTDYAGGSTHRWFYDYRDLTRFFVKGKNVIAAEVFRSCPVGRVVSRGRPGFLFEAAITAPTGEKQTVGSDESWRTLAAPQYPNALTFDASKEPTGWRSTGFQDSAWLAPRVVEDIWSPLVPSEIPPLMEARYPEFRLEGLADKVILKDCTFRVVFDRALSGYPSLKFKGGKGTLVKVKATNEADVILGDGETRFEFPCMTEVAPAYTVELKNVSSPVEVLEAGLTFTSQPVEYRGSFECSDDKLNQIWQTSRWAVQICLQTHHLDSPNHQEPISDPGDYVIESMVNHYAFAQPWLTRQDIRKFAWLLKDEKYHNFHTSYSIAWLQMLLDYYDYTGDVALVKEMSPYVNELLDTFTTCRGKNGIISEAPNYMFMDWVTIGGFPVHHPPAVIGQGYLTAFYYHGLELASRVAGITGNQGLVDKYTQLRSEVAAAFNRELWNTDKGLYRDGKPFQTSVKPGRWLPADTDIETFSPHVNLLAVLYGLAPKGQQIPIVEKVMSEKPLNTQPWFMHWVFPALDQAGLFDEYATDQTRRWTIVPQTQTFREMWTTGDLSHGWCSTPLVQMSQRILGVSPSSPGFRKVKIRPHLCDLNWARGKVPTPLGDLTVMWSRNNGGLGLQVSIPQGCEADIYFPVDRFDHPVITRGGIVCEQPSHVAAGDYTFVVTGAFKP